jgi:hypothetical protein
MNTTAATIRAGNPGPGEPLVIETDLTEEETAMIDEGRRNRKEHPENFTPWQTVKKKAGLA